MASKDKLTLYELIKLRDDRRKHRKIKSYFPETGPLRRELYVKHLEFFTAGEKYRQRLMLAANRVGKTEGVGAYEMTLHLTGDYPEWWQGRRFDKPIRAWAAGDTGKTVREVLQLKLLGPLTEKGTGMIPKDAISRTTTKQGISDAIDTVYVTHKTGGLSVLVLKSYDQRRISFQGSEQDIIWLDEEPDLDIYTECLMRTMTNNGIIMMTFTPLQGVSDTVLSFLPGGKLEEQKDESKYVVMASWDDAPHLSEEVKKELWNSIPPFQRDARSKGIPQLGAGAIFPVPESEFTMPDIELPNHWPRAFGLDVGWNRTAAVFAAYDRDSDTVYIYSEYYRGQVEPSVHAQGIKSRGAWIPGVIDPASRGRAQRDGNQLIQDYKDLGLNLTMAFNGVESGLYQVWERLSTGRLKVFKSCTNWLSEFRLYRRDEKGRIVKANDHLMDATRYLIVSGTDKAKTKPTNVKKELSEEEYYSSGGANSWMG
jgi:phage terminase large subunit-like protein